MDQHRLDQPDCPPLQTLLDGTARSSRELKRFLDRASTPEGIAELESLPPIAKAKLTLKIFESERGLSLSSKGKAVPGPYLGSARPEPWDRSSTKNMTEFAQAMAHVLLKPIQRESFTSEDCALAKEFY